MSFCYQFLCIQGCKFNYQSNINQAIHMIDSFIAGIPTACEGLNYLLPTKWWNEFYSLNKEITQTQQIKVPPLHLNQYVDDFLLNYQSQLVANLQEKCLYLNFHSVKINLQINNLTDWTPINPALWKVINKKLKEKNGIISFTDKQKNIDIKKTLQLQLIYCSKTRSQLFVGYIPKHANLVSVVRQIGFEMGFVQVTRSKITFVQRSPQVSYAFHQLQKYTVETTPDIFLMMFNMERREDDEEKILPYFGTNFESKNNSLLMDSNEAVVGDLNTMSNNSNNELNNALNRTISTGAQTPFSFALSQGFDLDRQYRVNQLFGAKQPQQIEEMKQYAMNKINNHQQLVPLPKKSQEHRKNYLQQLAQEALQLMNKRKVYKQKQNEAKQICK